jgi:hypothetical protein
MTKDINELPNFEDISSMTTMLFLLHDIQESALMNLLQEFKEHNFKFKTEYEHKTRKALEEIRKLKKPISKMDMDCQYHFGDVADMVYQLIFNIYVATGGYPEKLQEVNQFVLEYAKQNEVK